jgi:hypothetical protein
MLDTAGGWHHEQASAENRRYCRVYVDAGPRQRPPKEKKNA